MVLQTLEFSDCLVDGPQFRDKLYQHEKELDSSNKLIKKLSQEGRELVHAAKQLSAAQRKFANTLTEFRMEWFGSQQTDDEIVIAQSLLGFKELISSIEDARDNMLAKTDETFIKRLESFRKGYVGKAKDERKKFERNTKHYWSALEKHLKPAKVTDEQLREADKQLDEERTRFQSGAMSYVLLLQELQERKKFEFVEIVLSFMLGWMTFYHLGHESAEDHKPEVFNITEKLQKTRDNFDATREEVNNLMERVQQQSNKNTPVNKAFTRQGYLYALEKKTLGPSVWTKYFCTYEKNGKIFTMTAYHQTASAGKSVSAPEIFTLNDCTRKATDQSDRRFCFDITTKQKQQAMTLQALSDTDRMSWLEAMDGKEPDYAVIPRPGGLSAGDQVYEVNDIGLRFVERCIAAIEGRGLTDQGLYRVVGVTSKINKLMSTALIDSHSLDKIDMTNESEWEIKTLTSALKTYFRKLFEPVTTYRLHQKFLAATKQERMEDRVEAVSQLVRILPQKNQRILQLLIIHLRKVSEKSADNLMGVSNLAVCFGPTLLRPEEDSVAAIMDIKFCNVAVEILIEYHTKIFSDVPAAVHSNGGDRVHSGGGGGATQVPAGSGKRSRPPSDSSGKAEMASPTETPGAAPGPTSIVRGGRVSSGRRVTSPPATSPSTGPGLGIGGGTLSKKRSETVSSGGPKAQSGGPKAQSVGPPPSAVSAATSLANARSNLRPNSFVGPGGSYVNLKKPAAPPSTQSSSSGAPGIRDLVKTVHSAGSTSLRSPGVGPPNPAVPPPSMARPVQVYENTTVLKSPDSSGPNSVVLGAQSTVSDLSSRPKSQKPQRAMALYRCDAENESELSFEANEIIYDVVSSEEPGWLEGMLNGKKGMIPENYVKFME